MKVEKNSLQFKTRFTEKAKQKVLKIRQQNRKEARLREGVR
jgi:hypothetical protein